MSMLTLTYTTIGIEMSIERLIGAFFPWHPSETPACIMVLHASWTSHPVQDLPGLNFEIASSHLGRELTLHEP